MEIKNSQDMGNNNNQPDGIDDAKRWTTLKSEIIVSRPPWLKVRHDKVQLPDGRINPDFYVLEYPDWVNVIAITDEGLFVMERQYRYGIDGTYYEIPAGTMEEGETPEQAARRELEEETGYTGGEWTPIMSASGNASTNSNMTHSFLAVGVKPNGRLHLDSTEDLDVELMTREQVYRLLLDDQIKQSQMAAPLWRYFALLCTDASLAR